MGDSRVLGIAALALLAGGCATDGKLAVKPIPTVLAQGQHPVSFRVAEANGQLALGNVALALESFRKALRDEPMSIDALTGTATCYEVMGRFDLSRRYYETALAQAPADPNLLGMLAASLLRQGRAEEAAAIRQEMVARAAPKAEAEKGALVTLPLPVARAAPVTTVALATARPSEPEEQATPLPVPDNGPAPVSGLAQPLAVTPTRVTPPSVTFMLAAAEPPAPKPLVKSAGPRLERVSLGEVALVTRSAAGAILKNPAAMAQSSLVRTPVSSSLVKMASTSSSLRPILVLNAARFEGIAARTSRTLVARGFGPAMIGDAPRVRARTLIIAPVHDRARALRLARQFRVTPVMVAGARLTLVLGRDAIGRRSVG